MKDYSKFIRPQDMERLIANRENQRPVQGTSREIDFEPVCLFRVPGTYMLWMFTELDEDMIAFGGAQITEFELGSTWLDEMMDVDIQGLRVVQDLNWKPTTTLRGYAKMARQHRGLLII